MAGKKKRAEDRNEKPVGAARIVKRKAAKTSSSKKTASLSEVVVKKQRQRTARPSLLIFTLYFIYKNLYILGITLLRRLLRLRRRLRIWGLRVKGTAYSLRERLSLSFTDFRRKLLVRLRQPFQRIRDIYQHQKPAMRAERVEGRRFPFTAFFPVLEASARLAWRILATLLNYLVPILAAVYLYNSVTDILNRPVALKLTYDGQELGYIQNESVFDEAAQIVRGRIMDQSEGIAIHIPSFTIEEAEVTGLLDSAEIADMIISLSGSEFETAFGLYVGNDFVGAVTDKDPILDELVKIKSENTKGLEGERVEFVKSIRFNPELYLSSSVVDTQVLLERIRRNESEDEIYIVQDKDTPTGIADKNGMRYADLLRLNPNIEEELYPGDELQTKVARPFLSVKNIYVETTEEIVPYQTIPVENALYARGYEQVTQEGKEGQMLLTAEVTLIDGEEAGRTILEKVILIEPVDERVTVGVNVASSQQSSPGGATGSTDMTPSLASGGFIWPTSGGRATTYSGHTGNGIDIAPGGAGHPIYASASGTVTKVVNDYTGYGHYIVIRHEDGFETLYAHNSENYVSVGDYVQQGQVIASMGRTGWATGNHVHFEIRQNGRFLNPTTYVGYSAYG